MLKTMSNKKFTLVILSAVTGMIIVTFLFWGIGPKDNQAVQVLAEIDKEKVALDEFWRSYDNEYKRMREAGTTPEDIEKQNIKEKVLNTLVDRTVLMLAAQKAGITVPDKELQDAIVKTEFFQRNGVFDKEVYQNALRLNHVTPLLYEAMLKKDMVISKMARLIGETTELSPEEMRLISSIGGGNQNQFLEIFRSSKNNMSIKAYVEAYKRQLNIKINKDLIS